MYTYFSLQLQSRYELGWVKGQVCRKARKDLSELSVNFMLLSCPFFKRYEYKQEMESEKNLGQ